MADSKITLLNGGVAGTPVAGDYFPFVDDPGGVPVTKYTHGGTMLASITNSLAGTTQAVSDLIFFARPNGGTPTAYAGSAKTDWGFTYIVGDGVSVVSAKSYPGIEIPFACTITQVMLYSGTTNGNGTVDIWKKAGTALPAGTADSICGTVKPSFSGTNIYTDSTLTSWTTTINKGDWIIPYVTGAGTVTSISVAIRGSKPIMS